MKYSDFENKVSDVEGGRFEAELDRVKNDVKKYLHKDHVHVFDKKNHKEVATINGLSRNVTYQDLGLPTKLGELITEYAYTPIQERMASEIPDDDKHHNIMK
ncbi:MULTISPECIES: hypothetical protein [Lactobacillus]|uniref:Uncharacterized protein n=1 Tax=Lactobacillus xujianguonis TaxID=2495899 RepID=A0A437SXI8_9LACO|nr:MULTISPECIES: hypothetical protein [Lactobacillus]RVU71643.1 hypothetical protein EJK17_01335 [Lactobacillus xujianguonis]RVU77706.1 hypothetical protein EJK20_00375 [Lactobacillus xujianguonis]